MHIYPNVPNLPNQIAGDQKLDIAIVIRMVIGAVLAPAYIGIDRYL